MTACVPSEFVLWKWHDGDCCDSCLEDVALDSIYAIGPDDEGRDQCCCYALKRPYPDGPIKLIDRWNGTSWEITVA